MPTLWERIARSTVGEDYAQRYAARFRSLAESGQDTHGEASFVASVSASPATVLDAGCGTGRTTIRLTELGFDVVGVDVDESMLAMARAAAPELDWRLADLAELELGRTFDVVLLAGNVVPLVEPGTLPAVLDGVARHLAAGGRAVAGFGLDAAHLPGDCPATPVDEVLAAAADSGLVEMERWSTWDREPYEDEAGYVVLVLASAG